MRLPEDKTPIMRTGHAPVKAEQMVWYLDTTMKQLACGSSEVPAKPLSIIHLSIGYQINT
ncbi:hypothetical protein PGH45_18460 [Legionella pneumophila]|nr:hypothetical protein [Legionella pneumophila]